MPEITQSFDIDQPPELVWRFFQDVPRVVTCMPGLEYGGARDGEAGAEIHAGKVRIKLGPVSAAFEGEATIPETDEAARSARIEGKGIDKRGGSRASATVDYKITENGAASRVEIKADIKLSGALAQMGRTGIVQDVAAQITEQFAESLRATLAAEAAATETGDSASASEPAPPPPTVPAEIRGDALLLKIIWRRIKALFGFAGR
ncbi:MAG: SRPBCC family protein [Rhodospirillaceae bacterium]|nr:SRPBCC family protein [Rhodospirillaceae bacterium]MBT5039786.1 SRPBCC family protein [Rhodospirillaceae bacterium]MBT5780787.1 SRPBCC family protein [Rhodospirillaceae bacterium]